MEKYYYPDEKLKKQCMDKVVQANPDYRKLKVKIAVCLITGVVIVVGTNILRWMELVQVNIGYIAVEMTGKVLLPIVAYALWRTRYNYLAKEFFWRREKTVCMTEEKIEFSSHDIEMETGIDGNKRDKFPNSLVFARYQYENIRAMKFDPMTHVLTLKGPLEYEVYWDYARGTKDTIDAPNTHTHNETKNVFLLCYPEWKEILDTLYDKIKDTVWEDIEKTW